MNNPFFSVVDDELKRNKPWPEPMTERMAQRLVMLKWATARKHYLDTESDIVLHLNGVGTCAYCHLYGPHCSGCPVFRHTASRGCGDTPNSELERNAGKSKDPAVILEWIEAEIELLKDIAMEPK